MGKLKKSSNSVNRRIVGRVIFYAVRVYQRKVCGSLCVSLLLLLLLLLLLTSVSLQVYYENKMIDVYPSTVARSQLGKNVPAATKNF
jgi:hypothetical protein